MKVFSEKGQGGGVLTDKINGRIQSLHRPIMTAVDITPLQFTRRAHVGHKVCLRTQDCSSRPKVRAFYPEAMRREGPAACRSRVGLNGTGPNGNETN